MVNYMAKDKRRNQKQLEFDNKLLKEENKIYKDYIINKFGYKILNQLDLELAVLRTNELLEIRNNKEFELKRKEYENRKMENLEG